MLRCEDDPEFYISYIILMERETRYPEIIPESEVTITGDGSTKFVDRLVPDGSVYIDRLFFDTAVFMLFSSLDERDTFVPLHGRIQPRLDYAHPLRPSFSQCFLFLFTQSMN